MRPVSSQATPLQVIFAGWLLTGVLLLGICPATADPGTAAAPASGNSTFSFAEAQTISLAGIGGTGAPGARDDTGAGVTEPSVRVLRAEDDRLILEFTLPSIQVQPVQIEDETYHVLSIEGGAIEGADGQPTLPIYARMIQIPEQAGVTFEVTRVETIELPGYRPFPAQPDRESGFVIDREAYSRVGYLPADPVQIGAPAIARDLRVVPIVFRPVRYDPARETIEIAQRVEVHIRFAGVDLRNALSGQARPASAGFDELYRDLVVNYEGPRGGNLPDLHQYLIICPDDADVIAALQPLIEWRTRRGFEVSLTTLTETGSTREEIKDWLETAYTSWTVPPEYVCLIGDANGPIAIPCWYYSSGETDHPYTQLDGDDPLSDVFIGRISVDDLDLLRLYVTKIVGYESTPYMDETDWYTRACLVGDPTHSYNTCIQVMQWLKIQLLENGYTEVDTIFASPWVTQMVEALNQGDTVFSYRGYYGTSNFNNGHVYTLENGWKMPFAPTLTCGTGSFASGTSISEAWIRAGLPPDIPTGGIASIGIATTGTITRYNNCMTYGIWRSIVHDENYHFGQAFTRGKLELYINYYENDPGGGMNHIHWNNLMGDPAGHIWTGVPQAIVVSHEETVARGANSVTVGVTCHGSPCADAYVCLYKGGETHVAGYTNADGNVELAVNTPSTGEMLVTVTKHNHHPYLGSLMVEDADRFVGYATHAIDDDNSGSSSGNGDGEVNPLEVIELPVQVENFGTSTALGVTGTLTCDDDYVTIHDATETFGDIPAGGSAWCADDFDIEIDGGAPAGHIIRLGLDLQSGADLWRSLIHIPIASASFAFDALTLYDVGDEKIDPGETGELSVSILNDGDADATGVIGTLVSESSWLTVTDDTGTFGDIGIGVTSENTADRFGISASAECFQGHVASLAIYLEFSGGARDTIHLALTVGLAATDDPTGPDTYGYYAFDNTDLNYVQAPSYYWIEIDPDHGGPGTSLGLSDYGFQQDASEVVSLPFFFVFYGQVFTRATICSNGWISMGSTYLTNWRNWYIPGVGAPPYLIAPMWDDLYLDGDSDVCTWFDSDNHRFIIQWSRVRTVINDRLQNFQVILYDPAHYPTDTGDGEIVFQYETFWNTGSSEHYCTVGIENGDQTDGVLYTYFDQYNAGATEIDAGTAIKFATYSDYAAGILMGTVTNETNGGTPLEGATIHLLESGRLMYSGPDGVYGGGVPVGEYTVAVSHPSFTADTAFSVEILDGETTVVDFSLQDILPPEFAGTTQLPNTGDNYGPYTVSTTVTEYSDFTDLSLVYNVNGTGWVAVPMSAADQEDYRADIPGQAHGSLVKYHITAEDVGGNASTDPANAPWENYEFWVLEPFFTEDAESGTGDWFHYAVGDTFYDQWHLSVERNHTPGGTTSWKFGDEADGDYTDLADGALESPIIQLSEDAVLTFWHWMDAEVSGAYPGYCYDGGLVEMSVDTGDWTQITPVGGYPYLIRDGSILGPFPAETPVFSGSHDWTQAYFDLAGITGDVRFRFRFGSDGAVTAEGWHIDDVAIIPTGPGFSGADDGDGPGLEDALPRVIALHANAPNPFRAAGSGTMIRFDLPQAERVRLQVFDLSGRLVRTLVNGGLDPGRYGFAWDGRDASAHPVSSGVYYCVLSAAGRQQARQVLVVR